MQVHVVITTSLIFVGNRMHEHLGVVWAVYTCVDLLSTHALPLQEVSTHQFIPDLHSLCFVEHFLWKRERECEVEFMMVIILQILPHFFCVCTYLSTYSFIVISTVTCTFIPCIHFSMKHVRSTFNHGRPNFVVVWQTSGSPNKVFFITGMAVPKTTETSV